MACFALLRTDVLGRRGVTPNVTPDGFGPSDLHSAYALPDAGGSGATVAIVDAQDNPNAEADLAIYREQYGLPACTTANGCFKKVDQRGGTDYPAPDAGWAGEIALDLDMVSAACPACHIVLVEADSAYLDDLGTAVNQAVAEGAKYVSNSYGGDEDASQLDADTQYFKHPGVAITASSGDEGYGAQYPAASQYVTSVGGTALVKDSSTRGWSESVWNNSYGAPGSGCSAYDPKPAVQTDTGCDMRTIADVSAVADPETGVAVYNSYQASGWAVYGGTSASSPLIAGVYALAGEPGSSDYPNSYPYGTKTALNDVTEGNDGSCDDEYLCTAGAGYDGPTGLGTPAGITAFAPPGPHGDIVGTVTDAGSGKALPGITVSAGDSGATTDADGKYDIVAPAGTYSVTAGGYGYPAKTTTGVVVTDKGTTTADFALTAAPAVTLSGDVTDGSGHKWPLYASIDIGGRPGGPVFTDPKTGHYSVDVPAGATYDLTVTPRYDGYEPATASVEVGSTDISKDVALTVSATDCSAPGYQTTYSGLHESFDGTTRSRRVDGERRVRRRTVGLRRSASPRQPDRRHRRFRDHRQRRHRPGQDPGHDPDLTVGRSQRCHCSGAVVRQRLPRLLQLDRDRAALGRRRYDVEVGVEPHHRRCPGPWGAGGSDS